MFTNLIIQLIKIFNLQNLSLCFKMNQIKMLIVAHLILMLMSLTTVLIKLKKYSQQNHLILLMSV